MQSEGKSNIETGVYNAGESSQNLTAPPPYPGHSGVSSTHSYAAQDGAVVYHGPSMAPTIVPAVVNMHRMGYQATVYACKSCNHQILTRVERRPSSRTHLFALCLCLIGCWPLACLPYCMDSCNNVDHYCTNCGAYIGSYIS